MSSSTLLKCDVCFGLKTTIKCTDCTFNTCMKCIEKWFTSCGNFLCPQCKKERTYLIDYSKIKFKPREEPDLEELVQAMSQVDIISEVLRIVLSHGFQNDTDT